MKEKEAARLKVFCARKELTPFEHLSSNNVPSFIYLQRAHYWPTVGGACAMGCFPAERMYFLQICLRILARDLLWDQRQALRSLKAGESGERGVCWIVMANAYWVLVMCQFPSKQFTWIPSIILYNWPSYGVGLLNSPTLQMGKLRLKNLSKGS